MPIRHSADLATVPNITSTSRCREIEAAQPVGGGQNEVDRLVGERTEVFREETTSDGDPPGSAPRDDTPGHENERQQPDSAEGGAV